MRTICRGNCCLLMLMAVLGAVLLSCTRKPDYSKGTVLIFEVQPPASLSPAEHQMLTRKVAKVLQERLDRIGNFITGVNSPTRVEVWWPDPSTTPSEVTALVTNSGELTIRIVLTHTGTSKEPADLLPGSEDYQAMIHSLETDGAGKSLPLHGRKVRWMAIRAGSESNFTGGPCILRNYSGRDWILCYDDPKGALTHDGSRGEWEVRAEKPEVTSTGGLAMPFSFDATGAACMGTLTAENLNRPLAILVNDEALQAPMIQSRITASGLLTFGSSSAAAINDAKRLQQMINTSFRAKLVPVAAGSSPAKP